VSTNRVEPPLAAPNSRGIERVKAARLQGHILRIGLAALLVTAAALVVPREDAARNPPRPSPSGESAAVSARTNDGASSRFGHSLAFESNEGQLDPAVRFEAKGGGFAVWLTDRGATLDLRTKEGSGSDLVIGLMIVRSQAARPVATEPLRARSNYFRQNSEPSWIRGVPRFARVTYPGVYPGVDLVFHGEEGRLEYDFVVAPGASPNDAQLDLSGAEALSVDEEGALLIRSRRGVLRQPRPTVYQEDEGGARHPVEAAYRLVGGTRVAFAVGRYDETRSLVIDPVLLYSTYLGGSSFDKATAVAVDPSGNVYVAGFTASPDFPSKDAVQSTTGGSTDAFVAKLSPDGQELLYATYLGGSSEDAAYGIAVDANGSAYVTGSTESSDFPVFPVFVPEGEAGSCPTLQCSNGGASNAFVTKLAPDGSDLAYSTYLGGSGYDVAQGIAVDTLENVYIAGFTQSPDFPTISPFQSTLLGTQNAFVAKLAPSGATLLGSTYLGGSGNDAASALAVDAQGDVYVAGYTQSKDFPAHALQKSLLGTQNAFVTEFAPSLEKFVFSTYLGGSGEDAANAIALDASGNLFLAGATTSVDFPVQGAYQSSNAGNQDSFVAQLAAGGGSLVYSTFLGGSGTDVAAGLALDDAGTAYVVGQTRSADFPVRDAFQTKNAAPDAPDGNAFIALLDATGRTLLGSSYLGGNGGASAQAVVLAPPNVAWIAGGAGAGLPTKDAVFDTFRAQSANGRNAFLTRISADAGSESDAGVSDDRSEDPEASDDAADDASGTGVTVVTAPEDAPGTGASSGCGCREAETKGTPVGAKSFALLIGALLERRRRASPAKAG
jgi:hypothetical protein